jgi:hypothetical protein
MLPPRPAAAGDCGRGLASSAREERQAVPCRVIAARSAPIAPVAPCSACHRCGGGPPRRRCASTCCVDGTQLPGRRAALAPPATAARLTAVPLEGTRPQKYCRVGQRCAHRPCSAAAERAPRSGIVTLREWWPEREVSALVGRWRQFPGLGSRRALGGPRWRVDWPMSIGAALLVAHTAAGAARGATAGRQVGCVRACSAHKDGADPADARCERNHGRGTRCTALPHPSFAPSRPAPASARARAYRRRTHTASAPRPPLIAARWRRASQPPRSRAAQTAPAAPLRSR